MTIPANPTRTAALSEQMDSTLLRVIRDNISSQYASEIESLAEFRNAIANHGGTEDDTTLLADFRAHVPLSTYSSYTPFLDRFSARPCKEEDVANMFSPGLPDFFAVSSGTSGGQTKILPKYNHNARLKCPPPAKYFDVTTKNVLATLVCTMHWDIKVIERAPGEASLNIPVCIISGGILRRSVGLYIDQENRMSFPYPTYAVPWAATTIGFTPSFLIIHGLFFLANRDVDRFQTTFTTQFIDLVRYIDNNWDMLVSCIKDGVIPDLEGINHVRQYLQADLHPNPERAAELIEIGPPFSIDRWFARVWPKVSVVYTVCSGPFATALPKMRAILGPDVPIRNHGYASSEASIGYPYDPNKHEEFVLVLDDIVEFLDIAVEETHENICQSWEVKVGKHYEPILTTRDGLWRYRLGDVVHVIGFNDTHKSPVFTYTGRRVLTLRFAFAQVTDDQLLTAVATFSSDDSVQVQEFTTIVDDRALLPAVGFFVELAGPLGPNEHLVPQKLYDALGSTNAKYKHALEEGNMRLPTVRILRPGTFTEYRRWKAEKANIAPGQVKVPLVLLDPAVQEWILERVVREL